MKINLHQCKKWFGRNRHSGRIFGLDTIIAGCKVMEGSGDQKGKKQIRDIMKEDTILLKTRLKICFQNVLFSPNGDPNWKVSSVS